MNKAVFVQVTIYQQDSTGKGQVLETRIRHSESCEGWVIERMFSELGEEIAPLLDPYYTKD